MAARQINYGDSMDFIWEEAVYTEARLLADPRAADLAPRMGHILAAIDATRTSQYGAWRAELVAQAGVDAANDGLDAAVKAAGLALDRAVDGDHDDPRWKRYVGAATVKKIMAQGLEAEVKTVRTWPASLEGEPEKALQKQAKPMAEALERGDAALDARTAAAGRRRDFMARDKAKLVDALNDLRLDLHADLAKRVVPNRLDRAWPDGFFRKGTAKPARSEEPAKPEPQPA